MGTLRKRFYQEAGRNILKTVSLHAEKDRVMLIVGGDCYGRGRQQGF